MSKHQLYRFPTFIYYRDGKEVRRMSGTPSTASLKWLFRKPFSDNFVSAETVQ